MIKIEILVVAVCFYYFVLFSLFFGFYNPPTFSDHPSCHVGSSTSYRVSYGLPCAFVS